MIEKEVRLQEEAAGEKSVCPQEATAQPELDATDGLRDR